MSTSEAKPVQPAAAKHVDPRNDKPAQPRPNARLLRISVAILLLVLAVGIVYGIVGPSGNGKDKITLGTTKVMRGPLTVSVTEGGALVALKTLTLKSEVEGQKTIVSVVDEGTVITQEDVDKGMVLVKLDSSDLEEQASTREISFYSAEANYTQAKENYDIQKKQNESNISTAELNVKFARMELERYLGAELAAQVLENREAFANLGQDTGMGGAAQQTLRNYSADVQLNTEEMTRAANKLDWTKKLNEKGYVSSEDLTADQLAVTRSRIELEAAGEELGLFKRYTLPKEAETRYSDYVEKLRELDRVNAKARSDMAQAEANLKSSEATYALERQRLQKTKDMTQKCTIRAPKPGRVVYASTQNQWQRRSNPIEAGQRVYQNQDIITIPDLSSLAARVKVHETDIGKVKVGQKALISVEALPGKSFPGTVVRMSPVASSADAWLNPEIKVYETDVRLDAVPDGLTPGMSATAEIIVAELKDALYVPISAVTTYRGQRVCLAAGGATPQIRPIETGYFTGKSVEIRSGLSEGEVVYVDPAQLLGEQLWDLTPEPQAPDLKKLERKAAAEPQEKGPAASAEATPAPEAGPPPAEPAEQTEAKAPEALPQPAQQAPEARAPTEAPTQAPTQAPRPTEQAQPAAQVDWRSMGAEMRNAQTDEERQKVIEKFTANMTPEERKQFQERMQAGRSMSPEDRARRRQQYGEGAGGGGGGQGTQGQ